MRTILLICLSASLVEAATLRSLNYNPTDPAQVSLVAQIRALQVAGDEALQSSLDSTATAVADLAMDDSLRAFGVAVLPDSLDPAWVQVQLPLEGSEGIQRAFLVSRVVSFVDAGGRDLGNGLVRTRADWAVAGLRELRDILEPPPPPRGPATK